MDTRLPKIIDCPNRYVRCANGVYTKEQGVDTKKPFASKADERRVTIEWAKRFQLSTTEYEKCSKHERGICKSRKTSRKCINTKHREAW